MRLATIAAGVALATLCVGGVCGPAGPDLPDPGHSCLTAEAPANDLATLVLGTGEGDGFTPLSDGQTLTQEYGFQGGSHLTLSLRLFSATPAQTWSYEIRIFDADDQTIAYSVVPVDACSNGWTETIHARAFVEMSGNGLSGTLEVKATPDDDPSATPVTASVQVVVQEPT